MKPLKILNSSTSSTTASVSHETANNPSPSVSSPLYTAVEKAVKQYLAELDGQSMKGLYHIVLGEMERSLLKVALAHTQYNQSRAAQLLGLSRGTLHKKLKQYAALFVNLKE